LTLLKTYPAAVAAIVGMIALALTTKMIKKRVSKATYSMKVMKSKIPPCSVIRLIGWPPSDPSQKL
jgi:hypothetical protein